VCGDPASPARRPPLASGPARMPGLAWDLPPALALPPASAGRNTAAFSRRRRAMRTAVPALAQRSQHA